MKVKSLIIVCLIFFFKLGMGQEYEKIVDTTKMWVVLNTNAGWPSIKNTYAIKIKDSVILSDQLYWFKLWKATDSTYSDWKHEGYIRETNKIVFYQENDFRRIDTIYNFNKKVGDTLFYYYCFGIVSSIETAYFAGKQRFVQDMEPFYFDDTKHYEGIGSTLGVVTPFYYCYTGAIQRLLCYFKDGELLYKDPKYTDCYIKYNSINNDKAINIKPEPNPTNGATVFELPGTLPNAILELYTILGNPAGNFELAEGKNTLNLSYLTKGIYMYVLKAGNTTMVKGKIIIN